MEGYVFETDADEDLKKRLVACFFGPGERVNVISKGNLPHLDDLVASASPLVVDKVYLTPDSRVEFSFQGFEGRFNGAYFTDARECRHSYGTLIRHDNKTYVVAFSDNLDDPVATETFEIEGEPERHVGWSTGLSTSEELTAYLAENSMVGEFHVAAREDGTWSLVAISWSSSATERDLEVARQAIDSNQEPVRRLG